MRVSTDPKSEFFWQKHFRQPEIYLDDKAVAEVVEADSDAGYVRVIDCDEGGRPKYAGGVFLTKTLRGKVRIEEKENKK